MNESVVRDVRNDASDLVGNDVRNDVNASVGNNIRNYIGDRPATMPATTSESQLMKMSATTSAGESVCNDFCNMMSASRYDVCNDVSA